MKSDDDFIPDHPGPQSIIDALGKQKTVKTTSFGNWSVSLYFGPAPKIPGDSLDRLEYTASASTTDRTKGPEANLSGKGATRVNSGDSSVIWWCGDTLEDITKAITDTFPQFSWEKETPDGK